MSDMKPITYPMRPMNGGNLNNKFAIVPRWPRAYEPKANGHRLLVHVPTMTVFNRHGELYSAADEYRIALENLRDCHPNMVWLDCEGLSRRHDLMRGTLLVLDLIEATHNPRAYDQTYAVRRGIIESEFNPLPETWITMIQKGGKRELDNSIWYLPKTFYYITGTGNQHNWPKHYWEQLQRENEMLGLTGENVFWEGLVCKKLSSTYTIQLSDPKRESTNWIKHRFI